jgi:hypothetical protein
VVSPIVVVGVKQIVVINVLMVVHRVIHHAAMVVQVVQVHAAKVAAADVIKVVLLLVRSNRQNQQTLYATEIHALLIVQLTALKYVKQVHKHPVKDVVNLVQDLFHRLHTALLIITKIIEPQGSIIFPIRTLD